MRVSKLKFLILLLLPCLLLAGCQKPTEPPIADTPQSPDGVQPPTEEQLYYHFEGNCFDNDFDQSGFINPKTGNDLPLPTMKRTEDYYPHARGTLYFKASAPADSLVFLFYDSELNYIGYHSFNGVCEGQYGAMADGYFRCYVTDDYTGSIYLSTVIPDETPDYERQVTQSKEVPQEGITIVNFGDSIFGNIQNATSISAQLTELRGDTVYNCGFGGATMGRRGHAQWDSFSFTAMADAICDGDFSKQEAALDSDTYFPNYFGSTLDLIQRMNWSEVDVITVAYGTNDYTENVDIETCTEALQHAVTRLQERFPHIKLLVITPIWRYFEDGTDSDVKDYCGHGTLIDYKSALLATAAELQLPALDSYEGLPMLKQEPLKYFQENDRTHTNELGRAEYTKLISAKLDELLPKK